VKVVIDTNVFISSFISPQGAPRKVIDLWHSGRIQLCLCAEILDEYLVVLDRLGVIGEGELRDLLGLFRSQWNLVFVVIDGGLHVVEADPADDKFVECAVKSGANFIVSGDKHLKALKVYGAIPILSPSEFLKSTEV
jgi:putative PIN family toxin of toxin-antitoxin system